MKQGVPSKKGTNKDIANFLNANQRPAYNRQDSGLTRDSGDLSGRAGFGAGGMTRGNDYLGDIA